MEVFPLWKAFCVRRLNEASDQLHALTISTWPPTCSPHTSMLAFARMLWLHRISCRTRTDIGFIVSLSLSSSYTHYHHTKCITMSQTLLPHPVLRALHSYSIFSISLTYVNRFSYLYVGIFPIFNLNHKNNLSGPMSTKIFPTIPTNSVYIQRN